MRTNGLPRLVACLLSSSSFACVGEIADSEQTVEGKAIQGLDFELERDPQALRGGYQLIDDALAGESRAALAEGLLAAPAPRVFYLNRGGGTYSPGAEDSRRNRSSILRNTVTMPAYSRGDAAWSTFLGCVKDEFARFNLTVTDVDPGPATSHFEALISGRPPRGRGLAGS